MKNFRLVTRLLLACIVLTWLSAGCNNGNTGTIPQNGCRIQRIVTTTKSPGTDGTSETVYDYDAAGNLLKRTKTSVYAYSAGGSQNTTNTDTYTYNADNFLITSTLSTLQKTVSFTGSISTYEYTSTKTYTYINNQLAGYTERSSKFDSNITSTSQPQTYTAAGTYEYDASGQLTKQLFSNGETWTYRNGQAVDHTGAYPYILQNGLITKASFPGTMGLNDGTTRPYNLDQVFRYDDQRRLIQYQEFYNDTLKNYHTQEWQDGKPAELTLPAFKGHPVLKSPSGERGVLTRQRMYTILTQPAGRVSQYYDVTCSNQLNAQGFVTSTKQETLNLGNGQTQTDVTTTVHTYTGCN